MRRLWLTLPLMAAFALTAFGDDTSDRTKLIGVWQFESGADRELSPMLTLENKADGVRVARSQNGQTVEDLACDTFGRECEVKESGHSVKISMWYSGPKLVALETRGNVVVKKRFGVTPDGDKLEVEVIPIQPTGKAETAHFVRVHSDSTRPTN